MCIASVDIAYMCSIEYIHHSVLHWPASHNSWWEGGEATTSKVFTIVVPIGSGVLVVMQKKRARHT